MTHIRWILATIAATAVGCLPDATDESSANQESGGTTTAHLTCNQVVLERGSTGLTDGQTVSSLAVRDQSGTADTWKRYVNFDKNTSASCVFALPAGTSVASVVAASLNINYRGPRKADMLWTFTARDAVDGSYAPVIDNGFAADWVWTAKTVALPSPTRLFSNSGELRIRYASTSSYDNSMLDELTVDVTLDAGTTTSPPPDAGTPPPTMPWIYGVTVDDISSLSATVAALQALPKKPTARIVFDEGVSPSYYTNAVTQIHGVSNVMGEILDSEYVAATTLSQYTQRTSNYLAAFPTNVDIWEVGNEINGNWLGSASSVAAKMAGAYDLVKAAGKRTALTLYGCSDAGASYDLLNWARANVPARMLTGLDYVFVSYYEGDCGNPRSDWQAVFDQLHQLFPNAALGFGEVGAVDANGNRITNTSIAAPYLRKYYGMTITTPNYVGGYFWWYFVEDMVPSTKSMFTTLYDAILAMP